MPTMTRGVLTCFLLLFAVTVGLSAEQASTNSGNQGCIHGLVRGRDGRPLSRNVSIEGSRASRAAFSDAQGRFRQCGLPYGEYAVSLYESSRQLIGYRVPLKSAEEGKKPGHPWNDGMPGHPLFIVLIHSISEPPSGEQRSGIEESNMTFG